MLWQVKFDLIQYFWPIWDNIVDTTGKWRSLTTGSQRLLNLFSSRWLDPVILFTLKPQSDSNTIINPLRSCMGSSQTGFYYFTLSHFSLFRLVAWRACSEEYFKQKCLRFRRKSDVWLGVLLICSTQVHLCIHNWEIVQQHVSLTEMRSDPNTFIMNVHDERSTEL